MRVSNDILSQEEIEALLSGALDAGSADELEEEDKDLLGEIGNICMGSAATTLSVVINQPVSITTPKVELTTLGKLKERFEVPNVSIEVNFSSGLAGANLLVLKVLDAGIIADLMMGGDGKKKVQELSEIELSAVSEAMNQMVGTAATSMATMFSREINISPPSAFLWSNMSQKLSNLIDDSQKVVRVSFKLTVGNLIDSEIMQLLPVETARSIIEAMTSGFKESSSAPAKVQSVEDEYEYGREPERPATKDVREKEVPVHKAQFMPLDSPASEGKPRNIDLILDVPIEVSAILGRTKKTIKEILDLANGSLIELDKLVEEPVDILVNGKMVAQGEVVVVDENFGVRITNIVSNYERVKGLKK